MNFPCSLYSGAGNTFVLIDNRERIFPYSESGKYAQSFPVDGLILVEKSERADFFMRIFNRDGSEAEMCGNGLRCFIKFLEELEIAKGLCEVETLSGTYRGWSEDDGVCIEMPLPLEEKWNLPMDLHFLNTGVPHAVRFVSSIEKIDVEKEGRAIRYHPFFAPHGTNVDFVQILSNNALALRTYERGVEGETGACGTGAVAAACAAQKQYSYSSPITIHVQSGDTLQVVLEKTILLKGRATCLSRV